MTVTIYYVDGTVVETTPDEWKSVRAHGVDCVEIRDATGVVRFTAMSIYWLYREGPVWILGAGAVRYDPNPLTEVLFYRDTQTERKIDYMPDLELHDVKLGWWRRHGEDISL